MRNKISLALATEDCQIVSKVSFPTRIHNSAHKIIESTLDELETLIEQEQAELKAIGIECAGPIDTRRGITLSPPNLPGLNEFHIVEIINERLKVRREPLRKTHECVFGVLALESDPVDPRL